LILITGANGNLGRRLLAALDASGVAVRAAVRSRRAAAAVQSQRLSRPPEVVELDYLDRDAMTAALTGCTGVVHLVGIIKEGSRSRYEEAHEGTTAVLVEAAARAGVERMVYLSILGASPDSANACLRSKGRGERILLDGPVPVLVLRVPMVLGEGDYASRALGARARRGLNVLLRGGSLEQPIYAGDVVAAVVAGLTREVPLRAAIDLAGPRSLTRSELTRLAAGALGRQTRVVSLPLGLGLLMARVLERLSADPPVTRAMLEVLDHDDQIDPAPAAARLGVALTPLEEALSRCLT